jgi:hypothetical protein
MTGWMIPWGLVVYQHGYQPSDSNKDVDISFIVNDTFQWTVQ